MVRAHRQIKMENDCDHSVLEWTKYRKYLLSTSAYAQDDLAIPGWPPFKRDRLYMCKQALEILPT